MSVARSWYLFTCKTQAIIPSICAYCADLQVCQRGEETKCVVTAQWERISEYTPGAIGMIIKYDDQIMIAKSPVCKHAGIRNINFAVDRGMITKTRYMNSCSLQRQFTQL